MEQICYITYSGVEKNFLALISFLEELKDGNLKRECFEESCDQHENYEVFDDQENHRESWSKEGLDSEVLSHGDLR